MKEELKRISAEALSEIAGASSEAELEFYDELYSYLPRASANAK